MQGKKIIKISTRPDCQEYDGKSKEKYIFPHFISFSLSCHAFSIEMILHDKNTSPFTDVQCKQTILVVNREQVKIINNIYNGGKRVLQWNTVSYSNEGVRVCALEN